MIALLLALFLPVAAMAQNGSFSVDHWQGLNDTDSPATLQPGESPDLLNVESNIGGTAIIKREGYSLVASLTCTTCPVNGSYQFIDVSGNSQIIVGHGNYLAHSVNGGGYTNIVSSASAATRWSFVDINGTMYGVNSSNDNPVSYDGTTFIWPFAAAIPHGSLIELTKDRMVISGSTATPNRLFLSQSGVYTNFVVGPNSADPWTEDIGTSGDKITAIKYTMDRLFVFKRQSIVSCILGDQYTTTCYPVSSTLGVLNSQAVVAAPGGLYFQAQNGSFWLLNAYGLSPLSRKQSALVSSQPSSLGNTASVTESGQPTWNSVTQSPALTWDSTSTIGSIFNSSTSFTNKTTSDFSAGSVHSKTSTNTANSVYVFQPSTGAFVDAGGEIYGNSALGPFPNWTTSGLAGAGQNGPSCGNGPSHFGSIYWLHAACTPTASGATLSFQVNAATFTSGVLVFTATYTVAPNQNWKDFVINLTTAPAAQVYIVATTSVPGCANAVWTSVPFVRPDYISLAIGDSYGAGICPVIGNQSASVPAWDIDEGTAAIVSGSFTSQCFDTTYSTPTYGTLPVVISSSIHSQLYFQTQVASSCSSGFDAAISTTQAGRINSAAKRALRYVGTFTLNAATHTPAGMTSAGLTAATTGQFWTACIPTNSNLTSWGTISCDFVNNGAGSTVIYATAALTCGTLPQTPPTATANAAWTQQTNNTTINLSVANSSNVSIGFVSLLGSATDQTLLNSCTLSWNTGSPPQPTWAVYDHIKNVIYWATAINNSATNNRFLKYDLNLDAWFPFDIPASAPRLINNTLYFGGSSSGTWYSYGTVNTDAGNQINAYWKSKDFPSDPFRDTTWQRLFLIMRNSGSSSITTTLTNSLAQTDSYSVTLSTNVAQNYVRSSHAIKLLSPTAFMSVKIGNTASNQPFEMNGLKLDYFTQAWNIQNP